MTPKYLEIADRLELDLRSMRADGISKLPPEQELCDRFAASRQTVRSALDVLERKGLIVKKHGSGSYLADSVTASARTVMMIVEDSDRYIYPSLISHIRKELDGKDLTLDIRSSGGTYHKECDILTEALNGSYCAVIIEPLADAVPGPNEGILNELTASGIPVIYLYSAYQSSGTTLVSEDNIEGSSILMRHLVETGHDKIAGLFRVDDSRGLARYKGCIESCRDLGVVFDETGFLLYTRAEQDRKELFNRFISEFLPGKTAVICQNDLVAYQLINILNSKGIRVPEDVAVVSFDNSYYVKLGDISITSLGHSEKAVSTAVTEAVVAAVNKRRYQGSSIPWKLYVRNSG